MVMGRGADATANGKAEVDARRLVSDRGADEKARENKEGEVGGAKGASTAHRSIVDTGREREAEVGTAECVPVRMPLCFVAVFEEPGLDTRMQDREVVIKGQGVAMGVGEALGEKVDEARVCSTGAERERVVGRVRRRSGRRAAEGGSTCEANADGRVRARARREARGVHGGTGEENKGDAACNVRGDGLRD